jgi:uncharacterized protein (DUF488 family)
MQVWTIGHSTLPIDSFLASVRVHAIETVADVRRYPASRRHPHFGGEALQRELARVGVAYGWYPDLGGRREARGASTHNAAWRVAAFRAYADYMGEPAFSAALAALEATARSSCTAIMCAEALWTKCHRRLIADALTVRGWTVLHVIGARREAHRLPDFAHVEGGSLSYPA